MELLAWSEDGTVRVERAAGGGRALVYATPGATMCLMGVPTEMPASEEALRAWYAAHPTACPTMCQVSDDGDALLLPGDTPLPRVVLTDPALAPLRALVREAYPTTAEEAPAVDAPARGVEGASSSVPDDAGASAHDLPLRDTEARASVDDRDVDDVADARDLLLTVVIDDDEAVGVVPIAGEPPHLIRDRRAGEARIFGASDAVFVVVQAPADPRVATDLEALMRWYDAHPDAHPAGYRVCPDGTVVSDGMALLSLARMVDNGILPPAAVTDGSIAWDLVLAAAEASRASRLRERAVPASKLRAFVAERHTLPAAILGSDGTTLYAPLVSVADLTAVPAITGRMPHGETARILRLDLVTDDLPGRTVHLFAPVGGEFVLTPVVQGEAAPEHAVAVALQSDGRQILLPSTERTRVWSQSEPLALVEALPPRRHRRADTGASTDAPASSAPSPRERVPAADPVDGPDDALELMSDDEYHPSDEELAALYADAPVFVHEESAATDAADDEAHTPATEDDPGTNASLVDETAPQWHSPMEGFMSLTTWPHHSPAGEFWVTELLEALTDGPAELDALGVYVPLRLFRQGFPMSRSDKTLLQETLAGPLADRLATVRVFEIEKKSYFARETSAGIRLIGPRGAFVKNDAIRRRIALAYGRDPATCFLDRGTPARPAAPRAGRGRRAMR